MLILFVNNMMTIRSESVYIDGKVIVDVKTLFDDHAINMKGGKVKADEDAEAMDGDHSDKDMKKKDDKKKDDAEGMKKVKAEEVEETEAEVTEASEEVLDTAEVQEDTNLSVASEDVEEEAVASSRFNLEDWVNQKVLKK